MKREREKIVLCSFSIKAKLLVLEALLRLFLFFSIFFVISYSLLSLFDLCFKRSKKISQVILLTDSHDLSSVTEFGLCITPLINLFESPHFGQ